LGGGFFVAGDEWKIPKADISECLSLGDFKPLSFRLLGAKSEDYV